jgi:serine/threonine protein phosphatase PrpC
MSEEAKSSRDDATDRGTDPPADVHDDVTIAAKAGRDRGDVAQGAPTVGAKPSEKGASASTRGADDEGADGKLTDGKGTAKNASKKARGGKHAADEAGDGPAPSKSKGDAKAAKAEPSPEPAAASAVEDEATKAESPAAKGPASRAATAPDDEPERDDDEPVPLKAAPSKGDEPVPPKGDEAATPKGDEAPSKGDQAATAEPTREEIHARIFGRTDVGQVREHNEDNFIVADLTRSSRGLLDAERIQIIGDRGTLLGVCDGMGGAAAGEVASQLAVDIIYQKMVAGDPPRDHDDFAARLVHAIESAGLRIFTEAKLDRSRRGMGTTSTIAGLVDDHLFLGQVGDSRGYILRGERLVQVTRDQSLVTQLIEAGQLTEEEAETFEHNNIILQALGTADSVQVDLTFVELRRGDLLMLCSDGLSGMIRADEIREVLRSNPDPAEACRMLTDRANQAGGHDNITVVVARFEGPGLAEAAQTDIDGLRYQKYQVPESKQLAPPAVSEPTRRPKDLDAQKISVRPRAQEGPELEVRDDDDDEYPAAGLHPEDSIDIPTEPAPQWLIVMMIASAVACVTIAAYYFLR